MARAVAAGMTAAISACGGGGGSGEGIVPFAGIPAGAGADPNDGGDAAFSAGQRSEITRRAHEKYMALLETRTPEPMRALSEWLLTQPEYDAAGAGTYSAWARFTDGRYFLYTDSWPRVDLSGDGPLEPEPRAGDSLAKAGLVAGKKEVPDSDLAVIMAADDGDAFDEVKGMQQNVAAMLKDQGWRIHGERRFTVDAVSALASVEMGIFYLAAHGGMFGPREQEEYAFITETRATEENEAKYRADIRTGRLIYHRDRNREKEAAGKEKPPCLAVTASYVKRHFKFSDGALVVTLCCNSGSPMGQGFRDALASGKAITHVAWDGNGNDYGARSMEYMFDRLTGANKQDPAKPKNRAFDMNSVWEFMGQKATRDIRPNLLVTPTVYEFWEFPKSDAYIKRIGAGFDLSNPVISELSVDSEDKLLIHGNFGSEPGEVSIGGTKVAVQSWDNDKLELVLPTGASDPPGSHGDVVVTARKRTSNRRVLTSWRGVVKYTYSTTWLPGNTGLLTCEYTIDLHVRGDAHELRTKVDGGLKRSVRSFIPASDTKVNYKASGTSKSGMSTTTWSGSGSLPYKGLGFEGNSVSLNGAIDVISRLLKIAPSVVGQDLLLVNTTTVSGSSDTKTFLPFHTNALGYTDAFGGDTVSYGTAFVLDAFGNVASYDKRLPVPPYEVDVASMRVRTDGMLADPAFDDTIGR